MTADLVLGFVAGVFIATVTASVGVSGAVFLLPGPGQQLLARRCTRNELD